MMPSRTPLGSNSYFLLPRGGISFQTRNLRRISRLPCKSSLRADHWTVRCHATALRSPYHHFCLVQIPLHGVNMDVASNLQPMLSSFHIQSSLLLNSPRFASLRLLLTSSFTCVAIRARGSEGERCLAVEWIYTFMGNIATIESP